MIITLYTAPFIAARLPTTSRRRLGRSNHSLLAPHCRLPASRPVAAFCSCLPAPLRGTSSAGASCERERAALNSRSVHDRKMRGRHSQRAVGCAGERGGSYEIFVETGCRSYRRIYAAADYIVRTSRRSCAPDSTVSSGVSAVCPLSPSPRRCCSARKK